MKIFLRTLYDLGIKKFQYRIRFEIKNIIYRILPSIFLENLFFLNLKPGKWDDKNLEKIKLKNNLPNAVNNLKSKYNFKFLNEEKTLNFPIVWNDKSQSKLWNFNLHYFDWSRRWLEVL